jgi:hypothetical protein
MRKACHAQLAGASTAETCMHLQMKDQDVSGLDSRSVTWQQKQQMHVTCAQCAPKSCCAAAAAFAGSMPSAHVLNPLVCLTMSAIVGIR